MTQLKFQPKFKGHQNYRPTQLLIKRVNQDCTYFQETKMKKIKTKSKMIHKNIYVATMSIIKNVCVNNVRPHMFSVYIYMCYILFPFFFIFVYCLYIPLVLVYSLYIGNLHILLTYILSLKEWHIE